MDEFEKAEKKWGKGGGGKADVRRREWADGVVRCDATEGDSCNVSWTQQTLIVGYMIGLVKTDDALGCRCNRGSLSRASYANLNRTASFHSRPKRQPRGRRKLKTSLPKKPHRPLPKLLRPRT